MIASCIASLFRCDGIVTPEQFGARGDGSDDTAALEKAAAWGRVNGGLHLRLTAGRTYAYTNNRWLCNIPGYLVVDGNGASLQNLYVTTYGDTGFSISKECLVFGTCWDEAGTQAIGGTWVPYAEGTNLADHAERGATSFAVGDASSFTPGGRALIYGFSMQPDGFPSTCRVFEYVTISAVSGGTITTTAPLVNSYRTDWPSNGHTPEWGPAKAISLSRATFQETARMVFNDVHFKADPAWDNFRSGRVWIGNYGRAVLNDCTGDSGMYIMQGEHFTDNGSRFAGPVEIDKFIETVTLNGVDYAALSQGTGAKRIVHNGTTIRHMQNAAALESMAFNGGWIGANPGSGSAIPRTWCLPLLRFDGTVLRTDAANKALLGRAFFAATFADAGMDAATRRTTLTIPITDWAASEMARAIRAGSVLTDAAGNPAFRVHDLPLMSGVDLVAMEGWRLDGGSGPVTLHLDGTEDVDMRGLIQHGPAVIREPATAGLNQTFGGRWVSPWVANGTAVISSADIPEPSTTPVSFLFGKPMALHRLTLTVEKPYTGPTAAALFNVDQVDFGTSGLVNIAQFDLKDVGQTDVALTEALTVPKVVLRTANAPVHADASDRAVWSLAITGHPVA